MTSQFTVRIDLDNAAFEGDNCVPEIAYTLREIANSLDMGEYYNGHSYTIRDINGNDVGRYKLQRDTDENS